MQKDFHYYGTYVLARLAGIKKKNAQIIATSAQFVDDSIEKGACFFEDGSSVVPEVTAHHAASIKNIDRDDQKLVWIPFHFLPGNVGKTFTEKLLCGKDSGIAREMVTNALKCRDYILSDYLIGITAHVYADTFAHYGFSGVSSRKNKIENDSIEVSVENPNIRKYIENKASEFFDKNQRSFILENIRSAFSLAVEIASGALGHGAVATYPDRPYLKWSFKYEMNRPDELNFCVRNNQETYLEACKALFNMFKNYASNNKNVRDEKIVLEFEDVVQMLRQVISKEECCEEREKEWNRFVMSKNIDGIDEKVILPYLGYRWFSELKSLNRKDSGTINNSEIYKFYCAANYHRNYVLKALLPKHGLFVV